MRVALVGYGKMGKQVGEILLSRGHEICAMIDHPGIPGCVDLKKGLETKPDGLIEFALPDGILDRFQHYSESGLPVVVGTTGWQKNRELARGLYEGSRAAILSGSNFSIGAHLFQRICQEAARLVNGAEEYDVALLEHHHTAKVDYPSGTALSTAQKILSVLERKKHIVRDLPDGSLDPQALQVASLRIGSVPGVHEMHIDSGADRLNIRHEARNRSGFALGAVKGLEWLSGKKGWYEVDTFIDHVLTGGSND